jgi:hypothetical protein
MNAGRLTVVLDDQAGLYNPENTGSSLSPNVVPLRPIRVRATHNSVTYGLFFGWITRIEHNPSPTGQETRIEAIDFFHWLDAMKPGVTLGTTTVGNAIAVILGHCGLSDPAYLALDTGHDIPFLSTFASPTQTKSALTVIQELLAADMGVLFVDGDGKVTYQDTDRRDAPGSSDAAWTQSLIGDARPATDIAQVRNSYTVTRLRADGQPAGPPQTAFDPTTRDFAYYGYRDGEPLSTPYLMDDAQALALAEYKVRLHKDPVNPVRSVRLSNRDDTSIVQQLARDLGDRVTLSENLGGTSTTGFVEGVSHHVWEAGKHHTVSYVISKRRLDSVTY